MKRKQKSKLSDPQISTSKVSLSLIETSINRENKEMSQRCVFCWKGELKMGPKRSIVLCFRDEELYNAVTHPGSTKEHCAMSREMQTTRHVNHGEYQNESRPQKKSPLKVFIHPSPRFCFSLFQQAHYYWLQLLLRGGSCIRENKKCLILVLCPPLNKLLVVAQYPRVCCLFFTLAFVALLIKMLD